MALLPRPVSNFRWHEELPNPRVLVPPGHDDHLRLFPQHLDQSNEMEVPKPTVRKAINTAHGLCRNISNILLLLVPYVLILMIANGATQCILQCCTCKRSAFRKANFHSLSALQPLDHLREVHSPFHNNHNHSHCRSWAGAPVA